MQLDRGKAFRVPDASYNTAGKIQRVPRVFSPSGMSKIHLSGADDAPYPHSRQNVCVGVISWELQGTQDARRNTRYGPCLNTPVQLVDWRLAWEKISSIDVANASAA